MVMQYLVLNGNQQTINTPNQDTTIVNVHQLITSAWSVE